MPGWPKGNRGAPRGYDICTLRVRCKRAHKARNLRITPVKERGIHRCPSCLHLWCRHPGPRGGPSWLAPAGQGARTGRWLAPGALAWPAGQGTGCVLRVLCGGKGSQQSAGPVKSRSRPPAHIPDRARFRCEERRPSRGFPRRSRPDLRPGPSCPAGDVSVDAAYRDHRPLGPIRAQ